MSVECSICRTSVTNGADISSTPCGHVFHDNCIKRWFENASNCPQCRFHSTIDDLHRLYFDVGSNASRPDLDTTANCIDLLKEEYKTAALINKAAKERSEAMDRITLLERELQNKRVENNKLVADVRSVNEKLVREREINRKMMAESFVKNEIIVGYKRKEAVLKRDIEKIRQDKNAEIEKMRDERKTMLKQHKEEMQAANSANRDLFLSSEPSIGARKPLGDRTNYK